MGSERHCERGFTLVEVMCAMAIAALAMVVLFRTVVQSTAVTTYSENRMAAAVLAQSLLADALQKPVTKGLGHTGANGTFKWTISADRAASLAKISPRGFTFYDVTVEVTWPPRGRLAIATVALGR